MSLVTSRLDPSAVGQADLGRPNGASISSSAKTVGRPGIWRRLGLTLLSVSISLAVTLSLRIFMGDKTPPFLLFLAAVAVSAGYGGLWFGLLATVLSGVLTYFFVMAPRFVFVLPTALKGTQIALFVFVAVVISALSEGIQVSMRKAEQARQEVERSRRRLMFLNQASSALDASLDYETTLQNLARVAVPFLADWCAIDILDEDMAIRPVAFGHFEKEKENLIARLQCRYPLDPHGRHPVQNALRTGHSDIYLDIPESALMAAARDEEHLDALRQLNIRSYLCVPLRGRDRLLGTILFVSSVRQRYFESDRALAEDLARQAAFAVDNARLYQEAQQEIGERKRAQNELRKSQEQMQSLNVRLKRAMVETHHRVKNNLQIITAMMDMRLMDGEETISVVEIERLKAYIYALAAVHDILTQEAKEEGEARDISSRAVLEKLLSLMQKTAGNRSIRYNLEEARLPAKQGTSLALVVNELISNAIKYGRGEITVEMHVIDLHPPAAKVPLKTDAALSGRQAHEEESPLTMEIANSLLPANREARRMAVLQVCDDGPGFPADFDPAQAANTGLDLIENLSRWDLGGEARYENKPDGGGRVSILIPLTEEGEA